MRSYAPAVPDRSAMNGAQLVRKTLETKPRDGTHWTVRRIAGQTRVSKSTVHRIWRVFGLESHRHRHYKLSTDPFFVEKVRDTPGSGSSRPRIEPPRSPEDSVQAPDARIRRAEARHHSDCSGRHGRLPLLCGRRYLSAHSEFVTDPAGGYVDSPPESVDFVIEACYVNSKLAVFSELEYLTPRSMDLPKPATAQINLSFGLLRVRSPLSNTCLRQVIAMQRALDPHLQAAKPAQSAPTGQKSYESHYQRSHISFIGFPIERCCARPVSN